MLNEKTIKNISCESTSVVYLQESVKDLIAYVEELDTKIRRLSEENGQIVSSNNEAISILDTVRANLKCEKYDAITDRSKSVMRAYEEAVDHAKSEESIRRQAETDHMRNVQECTERISQLEKELAKGSKGEPWRTIDDGEPDPGTYFWMKTKDGPMLLLRRMNGKYRWMPSDQGATIYGSNEWMPVKTPITLQCRIIKQLQCRNQSLHELAGNLKESVDLISEELTKMSSVLAITPDGFSIKWDKVRYKPNCQTIKTDAKKITLNGITGERIEKEK